MFSQRYVISPEFDGVAIKEFLKGLGYSTRQIIRIKKDVDSIRLNGEHVFVIKPLKVGDVLEIKLSDEQKPTDVCDVPVPIIYEDNDVIVFNKPPNMACQVSKLHPHSTLQNCFAHLCKTRGENMTFRCLTRLDRDTSGLTLVAKNQLAAAVLSGKSEKVYYAIVSGKTEPSGTIDAPIGIENEWEVVRKILPHGQRAVTHYETLCTNDEYSFIRLTLETGRTHQIRVHMSHIGHTLLGDELYGSNHDVISRQALHCGEMSFKSVLSDEVIKVSAPLSEDMQKALEKVRLNCNYLTK